MASMFPRFKPAAPPCWPGASKLLSLDSALVAQRARRMAGRQAKAQISWRNVAIPAVCLQAIAWSKCSASHPSVYDPTAKRWVVRASDRLSHYDRQYSICHRIFANFESHVICCLQNIKSFTNIESIGFANIKSIAKYGRYGIESPSHILPITELFNHLNILCKILNQPQRHC